MTAATRSCFSAESDDVTYTMNAYDSAVAAWWAIGVVCDHVRAH